MNASDHPAILRRLASCHETSALAGQGSGERHALQRHRQAPVRSRRRRRRARPARKLQVRGTGRQRPGHVRRTDSDRSTSQHGTTGRRRPGAHRRRDEPAMSSWVALRRRIAFQEGQRVSPHAATGPPRWTGFRSAPSPGRGPDESPSALLRASRLQICRSGIGSVSSRDILAELPELAVAVHTGAIDVQARPLPLAQITEKWSAETETASSSSPNGSYRASQ